MTYVFPELVAQLKYLCTPQKYNKLKATIPKLDSPKFWTAMPKYVYAHCPFCGHVYAEAGNSYDIDYWGYQGLASNLCALGEFKEREIALHCSHFLGIRKFINLHGLRPDLKHDLDNTNGEIPFLDDFLLRQGVTTFCILHGLPVCTIENNLYLPSYTIFLMTYFSENPKQVVDQVYDFQAIRSEIDPEYWPTLVTHPLAAQPSYYDLAKYAYDGQLGWLDYTSPNLPLRLGTGQHLPDIYRGIEGNRKPYKILRPR